MKFFDKYLSTINNPQHRNRMEEVLNWVAKTFPTLVPDIKWNQPIFTDHGTYIIGFSTSKQHMAVAPERVTLNRFSNEIIEAGYDYGREIIRFPWNSPVDYSLLEKIIAFNIEDKKDHTAFWRKKIE